MNRSLSLHKDIITVRLGKQPIRPTPAAASMPAPVPYGLIAFSIITAPLLYGLAYIQFSAWHQPPMVSVIVSSIILGYLMGRGSWSSALFESAPGFGFLVNFLWLYTFLFSMSLNTFLIVSHLTG